MFFAEPNPIQAGYFKYQWDAFRKERFALFNLDLQRASNLQKLKRIGTLRWKIRDPRTIGRSLA